MEKTGIIFDIKEFALFDGPGIRTTVFLKGCPLRCQWCHNPEGQTIAPQLMVSHASCLHCGACTRVCKHPDHCIVCGDCVSVCPLHLRKICGTVMKPEELAGELLKDRDYLNAEEGGITFSGGEPTLQADFLLETASLLKGMHLAIETCGYCDPEVFTKVLNAFDLIMMDLKLIDAESHKKFTGVDNRQILSNLELLKQSGKPFWIRIPVIPEVNDSTENYRQTAALIAGSSGLQKLELLPYHKTAGAKYSMVDRVYKTDFNVEQEPNLDLSAFQEKNIPCSII